MSTIKVGVIGVGYLGKFHARKYAAMDDVELVGVADVDFDLAGTIAAECKTRPFADYHELIKEVDAVSIVVPTSMHHEVAQKCLLAGVDVMLEKPMTSTMTEADDLICIAEEKELILQVGHIERYNPAILSMAEYLDRPLFIESHRIHQFKPRGIDVDVVLDLMIHDIDIILSIVDSPIKFIHTVGLPVFTPSTDIANARLVFENGCTANITVSRISKDNMRRMRIFQPKSYISVDYGKKEFMVISLTGRMNENGMPEEEVIKSSFMDKDAMEMELTDFVQSVRTRNRPMVSGKEGRRALAVAQEIIIQIKDHAARHKELYK